jgi:sugar phosphate isomerase/epimerase
MPPATAIGILVAAGIRDIELSGGMPHTGLYDSVLAHRHGANLQVHNYFPPADPPFVFNLASVDEQIRKRTLTCMKVAIELSAMLGAARYGVHAGFLVDPPVSYLGRTWKSLNQAELSVAQSLFVDSVTELHAHAERTGIELLVENNVLTTGTRDEGGDEVLLMASAEQICHLMNQLPDGVGLLMDVAHLKVTAATLGFDPVAGLKATSRYIRAYHLSDNDGMSDSNGKVTAESWFWPHLDPKVTTATLEVAPNADVDFSVQTEIAKELWADAGRR